VGRQIVNCIGASVPLVFCNNFTLSIPRQILGWQNQGTSDLRVMWHALERI